MNKNSFLFTIIVFVISIAFNLVHDVSPQKELFQKNNESKEKKQWELEMLRDPATGKIPDGIRYKELAFYNKLPYKTSKRGTDWRLRGPWNVGGRTRGMAIDIRNENHMIAGSVSGGIWRTENGGKTWQKVSAPGAHPGVVSIAQDTRAGYENIWYALSGEIYGTSASGGPGAFYLGDGAFRSLDNGKTWESLGYTANGNANSFSSSFQGGWRIVTSPSDGAVYMAVYGSLYKSVDTGNTWLAIFGGGNNSYFTDVAVSENGVVYACFSTSDGGSTNGFYRSADGQSFTDITPAGLSEHNRTVIEIDPNNDNIAYFLSELECENCGGITTKNYQGDKEYVSFRRYTYINGNGSPSSGGGQWENLSNNLPLNSGNQFDDFNCQGGYDLCVRVQKGNSNNVVIGGTNLYLSSNAFNNNQNTKQIGGYGIGTSIPFFEVYPNHHPDQHDVFFSKNNSNVLYSISDGGVRKTYNLFDPSVQWDDISWGYVTSQCYTVNIDEANAGNARMMVGLQDNGNYVTLSDHQQQQWQMPVNGDGAFGYISPFNDFYVTSIQLGRIVKMKLDDRGNIVRRRRIDPDGKTKDDYSFINPLAVDPNNENLMYLPIGKRLYRMDNLASIPINNNYDKLKDAWVDMGDSITTPSIVSNNNTTEAKITCLAISQNPANIIYIGTSNKEVWRIDNANSANPIWIKCNTLKLSHQGNVNDIVIDPDDANKVLFCYSNYNLQSVFYSEDGGQNWDYAAGTLESSNNNSGSAPSVRSLAILKTPNGGRKYFAGTSIGLFSTDSINTTVNLTNWEVESPDLIGANIVTDIKVRQSDGFVAVATHGNGVFETYYNLGSNPPTKPLQIISSKLFPNPANNILNYSFGTGGDAEVDLMMFNITGRPVYKESLGLHTKGVFNYSLNTSSFPSGVYLLGLIDINTGFNAYQKIVITH